MKKNYYGLLLLLLTSHLVICKAHIKTPLLNWQYVGFHDSMKKDAWEYKKFVKIKARNINYLLSNLHLTNKEIFDFFEKMYNANNLSVKQSKPRQRIPKIIHQIWLGGKPLPKEYNAWQQSWLKHHPDWEYKLWTEKEIQALDLTNKALLDLADSYSEQSDIIRFELLYRFGGLYVDTDFECLKPLDIFHENYEFYCGIFLNWNTGVNGALIGSIPGHPVLKYYIDNLKNQFEQNIKEYMARSGPYFFTSALLIVANSCDKDTYNNMIALPPIYFYPWNVGSRSRKPITYPESYGVHYWTKTWMQKIDKTKKNVCL